LEDLVAYVRSIGDSETIARGFVDAGPVPERELAQRAGIGWIGKNTMLIAPQQGSFFFLAAVLTNLDLAIDDPFEADRCGTCRRCLDACPTDAFDRERLLDSRHCISYLTIEYKGDIGADLSTLMGDWVFGCDICQDVCPWNQRFASEGRFSELGLDPGRAFEDLATLCEIEEGDFRRRYGRTPLSRPGVVAMRRNAMIAVENSTREESCRTSQTQ
jgi:epoxyqueuosine reductase